MMHLHVQPRLEAPSTKLRPEVSCKLRMKNRWVDRVTSNACIPGESARVAKYKGRDDMG